MLGARNLRGLFTAPNRNTMDEVLNSGSLRLIRDSGIRTGLLDLYTTYDRIAYLEDHMARDFDAYIRVRGLRRSLYLPASISFAI